MAVARVQMPDGRIARLEVPEGTTPEQVESFVFNGMKTAKPLDAIDRSAMENMKPNALERVGRGFADVAQGVKQGYLTVKDMLTGGNEGGEYTADKTAELKTYEKGRGPNAGIDWARLGGNVLATAPAMAIPGGAAAGLGTRVASGAAQGGASSAAMFTSEGDSKIGQILTGAAVGGAVPVAVQGVKAGARRVGDMLRGPQTVNLSPAALASLEGQISLRLEQQGVDFKALTQDVRTSLVSDAKNALATGGTLDDVMLGNKAVIESVGATPTKASVTRNPKDWQTEQNLRGVTGVGEPIARRQGDNAAAMTNYLNELRTRSGAVAATPSQAGESTIKALRGQDSALKSGVDSAYSTARDHLGRAAPMDAAGFSKAANLALDDGLLGAYLPSEARTILNDVSAGKIPFNVNTAVQIDSTLAAAQRSAGQGSPQALAISKVRDALNNAGIADNVGEDAKRAFDAARSQARARFQVHEEAPALSAAVDDFAPDKFLDKFITGKNVEARQLRATMQQLRAAPEGAQAIADIKGHLFDSLLMKATGNKSMDDVVWKSTQQGGLAFSGKAFSNALNEIPPEKLHQLFSPAEVESLRNLQKASRLLTEEVPYSDVNYSKTAAGLANILQKIGETPLVGKLIAPIIGTGKIGTDWVKDGAQRKAVAEALIASAGRPGQRAALPVYEAEKLIAAPAAAAFAAPRDQRNQ